jgi:hypothetical protein
MLLADLLAVEFFSTCLEEGTYIFGWLGPCEDGILRQLQRVLKHH